MEQLLTGTFHLNGNLIGFRSQTQNWDKSTFRYFIIGHYIGEEVLKSFSSKVSFQYSHAYRILTEILKAISFNLIEKHTPGINNWKFFFSKCFLRLKTYWASWRKWTFILRLFLFVMLRNSFHRGWGAWEVEEHNYLFPANRRDIWG